MSERPHEPKPTQSTGTPHPSATSSGPVGPHPSSVLRSTTSVPTISARIISTSNPTANSAASHGTPSQLSQGYHAAGFERDQRILRQAYPQLHIVDSLGGYDEGRSYLVYEGEVDTTDNNTVVTVCDPWMPNPVELREAGATTEHASRELEARLSSAMHEIDAMAGSIHAVHTFGHRIVREDNSLGCHLVTHTEFLEILPALRQNGNISTIVAIVIGLYVCHALEGCHALNVVHGHLQPDSIYLGPRGCKLGDFGTAWLRGYRGSTVTHDFRATRYDAPELEHGAPWSNATDIYSLGAVLNEIGEWVGGNPTQDKALAEFLRIARKAASRTPQDRPQSVRIVREELERLLTNGSIDGRAGQMAGRTLINSDAWAGVMSMTNPFAASGPVPAQSGTRVAGSQLGGSSTRVAGSMSGWSAAPAQSGAQMPYPSASEMPEETAHLRTAQSLPTRSAPPYAQPSVPAPMPVAVQGRRRRSPVLPLVMVVLLVFGFLAGASISKLSAGTSQTTTKSQSADESKNTKETAKETDSDGDTDSTSKDTTTTDTEIVYTTGNNETEKKQEQVAEKETEQVAEKEQEQVAEKEQEQVAETVWPAADDPFIGTYYDNREPATLAHGHWAEFSISASETEGVYEVYYRWNVRGNQYDGVDYYADDVVDTTLAVMGDDGRLNVGYEYAEGAVPSGKMKTTIGVTDAGIELGEGHLMAEDYGNGPYLSVVAEATHSQVLYAV